MKRLLSTALAAVLLLTGCSGAKTETSGKNKLNEIEYTTPDGREGWVYVPDAVQDNPDNKVPLVMMLCMTGGDPQATVEDAGWKEIALEENLIILAPVYKSKETYSQTAPLVSAVEYISENYPVDTTRIYAAGFSNGGGACVALANDYPQVFASISIMSWMLDMESPDDSYQMPFQVIQGTRDLTKETPSGAMRISDEEVLALRTLMRWNGLIGRLEKPEYDVTEYWGYKPDEVVSETLDDRTWTFSNFYKEGYNAPFVQLVLIDDARHKINNMDAAVAWNFLRKFSRGADGIIYELDP